MRAGRAVRGAQCGALLPRSRRPFHASCRGRATRRARRGGSAGWQHEAEEWHCTGARPDRRAGPGVRSQRTGALRSPTPDSAGQVVRRRPRGLHADNARTAFRVRAGFESETHLAVPQGHDRAILHDQRRSRRATWDRRSPCPWNRASGQVSRGNGRGVAPNGREWGWGAGAPTPGRESGERALPAANRGSNVTLRAHTSLGSRSVANGDVEFAEGPSRGPMAPP